MWDLDVAGFEEKRWNVSKGLCCFGQRYLIWEFTFFPTKPDRLGPTLQSFYAHFTIELDWGLHPGAIPHQFPCAIPAYFPGAIPPQIPDVIPPQFPGAIPPQFPGAIPPQIPDASPPQISDASPPQ